MAEESGDGLGEWNEFLEEDFGSFDAPSDLSEDTSAAGEEEEGEEGEEFEEDPVPAGTLQYYGAGLLGGVVGSERGIVVVCSAEDAAAVEGGLSVRLLPMASRLKLLGSGRDAPAPVEARVEALPPSSAANRSFLCTYRTTLATSYQVRVSCAPMALEEVVRTVKVDAGPSHPAGCSVKGAGVRGAVSDIPSSFSILVADRFRNPAKQGGENVHVDLQRQKKKGEARTSKIPVISVQDDRNGKYAVTYVAPISGEYLLHVTLDGADIAGSPFTVQVTAGLAEQERSRLRKLKRKREAAAGGDGSPLPEEPVAKKKAFTATDLAAVSIQRAARCFIARRLSRALAADSRHKQMVVKEIVATEMNYVAGLATLCNAFLLPMKSKALLSPEEVASIFGNVQHLHTVNQSFLSKIQERAAITADDAWPTIGDLFVDVAPELKGSYSIYVNNYTKSLQVLDAHQNNQKLNKFLDAAKKNVGSELMPLLITPIQRLPRYELLLREALKLTQPQTPEYKNLDLALKAVREVNHFINESKRRAERLHRLLAISTKVYGIPAARLFDVTSQRAFRGQGMMTVELRKRTVVRIVILFNDCLLLARKKASLLRGSCNLSARFAFHYDIMKISIPKKNSLRLEEDGALATFVADKNSDRSMKFLNHMMNVIKEFSG